VTALGRIGWLCLALATLAIIVGVELFHLPEPRDAIVIDRAEYQVGNGPDQAVVLPHRHPSRAGTARYRVHFDLAGPPVQRLFLYIPSVNRRLTLAFNGHSLSDNSELALWSGPLVRRPALLDVPPEFLKSGRNDLTIRVASGRFEAPSYLSRMFIGTEAALAPNYRLRTLLEERLKTMALAAHLLLSIGIVLAYLFRPKDPLFSWLAAGVVVGMAVSIGFYTDFQFGFDNLRHYVLAALPALGGLFVGMALVIIGLPRPPLLCAFIVGVPIVSVLAYATGILSAQALVWTGAPLLLIGTLAATVIVAWGALRRASTDARILLVPFFLVLWFMLRDFAVAGGYLEGSLLVGSYSRPIFLAAVMAVLMRRLAMSLDHLDRANETLNRRLAEQEAELAGLHQAERIEAARLVREQERQRLTRDLHDGISGHLVSIIAMTERSAGETKAIEDAARRALDDLRLVIYSLDLGDRELSLALANFRERLIPQLQRLGVELDWSIADLPEVSGVTPGNALAVLRILQEAITNALKHGPARRIVIRGRSAGGGQAAITVENDGAALTKAGNGFGLDNMRHRARQLNGSVELEWLDCGARLTLMVPSRLPDFRDASAN
jgi:signal transduction histidine kinase